MNEINPADSVSDSALPNGSTRLPVPDTSLLPGNVAVPPATVGLLNDAVQGAHDTIDRLADGVTPAVRQLGESVSAAEVVLRAKADQVLASRDEWLDVVRTTVRGSPLVAVAAALTLGAVIARLTR